MPALLESLSRTIDRAEEHALIYALIEIGDLDLVMAGLKHPSPSVKRASLIVISQLDSMQLQLDDVEVLLGSEDNALRQTVLKLYQQHAASEPWANSAARQLGQWLSEEALAKARATDIQELLLAFAGNAAVAQTIGETLNHPGTTQAVRENLFAAIAKGNKLPLHESWVSPLTKGLSSDDAELVQKSIAAVSAIGSDRFRETLQQIGNDSSRSILLRVLATQAASGRDGRLTESAFALLIDLIGEGGESKELTLAVGLIANANLSKDQLLRLASLLKQAGPVEIRSLLPPYQRNTDPEVGAAFLTAMEQSRSLLSVPPPELSDIIKAYPAELRDRANALLERLRQDEQKRLTRLDQLLPQLKSGNAERGRIVFLSEKSKCSTCHRINEVGGRIGPDLTTIGANRASSDLLESIVFPSATLVRDYQSYNLLTSEGQTLTGLIVRDTGDEIFVQQQLGEPVRIARKDIESLVPSTVSLMPNGLDQALTEAELADVVAYLQSLKSSQKE